MRAYIACAVVRDGEREEKEGVSLLVLWGCGFYGVGELRVVSGFLRMWSSDDIDDYVIYGDDGSCVHNNFFFHFEYFCLYNFKKISEVFNCTNFTLRYKETT